jgi:chromosome segregation ATPase
MTTDLTGDADRVNDIEAHVDSKIDRLLTEYAQCDMDSADLTTRRAEIREEAEKLGFASAEFQEAVRKVKKMTKREREHHDANVERIIRLAETRQAELWPEQAKKAREREEARDNAAAEARTAAGVDPDTNPRSNPDAGGAKPQIDNAAEQAEGEAALADGLKGTTKASQSAKAAAKRSAAGLN